MQRRPRHWLGVALSGLMVCAVGCASSDEQIVLEHVEYQWSDGLPAEGGWLPADGGPPGLGDGRAIWYRVRVPAFTAVDPAVEIRSALFAQTAWVGGREVDLLGTLMIVPVGTAATEVTVRETRRGGLRAPRFVLGSQRAFWASALHRELPVFIVGAMMALAGALLLSTVLRSGAVRAYRGLGLFLFALGVLVALNSPLRQVLGLRGDLIYLLHAVATTLYPLGFADFVLATFGDGKRRLIRRGLQLYAVYTAVAWGLHLTGLLELHIGRTPVALFITAFLIQAIVLAARRARGNDPAARSFLFGIVALLVISIPDILDAASFVVLPFQTVPWALLGFGLAMIAVIERQHFQARESSEVAARDLAVKVQALEARNREVDALNQELRHQVAERSRQMVDVLQKGSLEATFSPPRAAGDTIDGRYRVIEVLGQGAMGSVYRVERLSDHRHFALKMMLGAVSSIAGARFAREAEIAARIDDAHLVRVVDVGGAGSGQLYLVMELVEGRSLEECRKRFGEVPWAVEVVRQLAAGLRSLHAAGVVHRDLKPANVLVRTGPDGTVVKISDFGISRLDAAVTLDDAPTGPPPGERAELASDAVHDTLPSAAAPASASREPSARLTATGAFMGTPAYMAPELARGADAGGPAADLFALGLIAYEALSGSQAFPEIPLVFALAGRSLPSPAPLPPAVPRAIAAVVARCLAESPAARPTAEELLAALAATD